jgi:hypothetical protein
MLMTDSVNIVQQIGCFITSSIFSNDVHTGADYDSGTADNGSDFQWTTPYLFTITEIKG